MQTRWIPRNPHEIDESSGLRSGFEAFAEIQRDPVSGLIDGAFVTLRIAEAFGKDGTVSVFLLEVIRKPTQGEPQTQRPRDRYQWRLRVGHLAPRVTDETRILKRSPIRILPSVCSCEQALPAKATTRAKAELWYFPSFLRTSIGYKTKSR